MKYSRYELVEKACEDMLVAKTIEAIMRTPMESSPRMMAVAAFEYQFGKVAAELFKENVGCECGEDVIFRVRMLDEGRTKLMETTGLNGKVVGIAKNEENFVFDIGTVEDTYISVGGFDIEDNETSIKINVNYTGDESVDKRIDRIIASLRR